VRIPPAGIASTALAHKFKNTYVSFCLSAMTSGGHRAVGQRLHQSLNVNHASARGVY
jgi:hypothetical protein